MGSISILLYAFAVTEGSFGFSFKTSMALNYDFSPF